MREQMQMLLDNIVLTLVPISPEHNNNDTDNYLKSLL